MNKRHPMISVIMAVHNGERYMSDAIESVLKQTFTDFELIVINDASTDNTQTILSKFKDERIRLFSNKQRLGAASSRNVGLQNANGKFIAILDSDDLCLPIRFEKQINYLNTHSTIGACGSWYEEFSESFSKIIKTESNPFISKFWSIFFCPMAHSSVMSRREVFDRIGHYNETFISAAEDFDLWSRARLTTWFMNIPEVLVRYRIHPGSVSKYGQSEQKRKAHLIVKKNLNYYLNCSDQTADLIRTAFQPTLGYIYLSIQQSWLLTLLFFAYVRKEKIKFPEALQIVWSLRLLNPIYLWGAYLFGT